MSDDEPTVTIYRHYCPPGVKDVIASGSSAFIGEVDDSTVLKYTLAPGGDMERLEVERRLLEIIGPHPRIIGYKGFLPGTGIYLERATNGTVAQHLLEAPPGRPSPSTKQRLTWCREAAEGVAWIHRRRVLHNDLQPTNLLLDEGLHIKLADFQGQHLSEETGEIAIDGWSSEPCRFSCPFRKDVFETSFKTDIFALGCNIYFIMMGHALFPDIIDGEEGYHEKVQARMASADFPPADQHVCGAVTAKCWAMGYESAEEVVRDLELIEKKFIEDEEKQ